MLIGWSWEYAQDQPISLLESESEIDKKFCNLGPCAIHSFLYRIYNHLAEINPVFQNHGKMGTDMHWRDSN